MSSSEVKAIEPQELAGIKTYLDVLIEEYPKPITRQELAEKTGVTQPAITKVMDRLKKLCNRDILLFNKKLVLLKEDTYWTLFFAYIDNRALPRFIVSNYGLQIMRLLDIHSKIVEKVPEYAFYFERNDTELFVGILLHNAKQIQVAGIEKFNLRDPQLRALFLTVGYATAIDNMRKTLDLPIYSLDEIKSVLRLRDRAFFFTKFMILRQLCQTGVVKSIETEEEKKKYLEVYSGTIDFYLKKAFNIFTDFVCDVAKKHDLEFKEEYRQIGKSYELQERDYISFHLATTSKNN